MQSVFGGYMSSAGRVFVGAASLIATRSAVPTAGGSVRITGNLGVTTGIDVRSGLSATTFLTVVLSPPIGASGNLPERIPVTIYPGCP